MDKSFTKILEKTVLAIGRYGRVDFLSFFLRSMLEIWETTFFKQETEKGMKFVTEEHAFCTLLNG
jgi:hypothetical protein